MKHFFRTHILPHITWWALKFLWWSWRVTLIEPNEMKKMLHSNSPFLLAHWHGDEMVLLPLVQRYNIATMTSTSQDGQLMTRIVSRLGGASSRGSSTRGGASALRGLVRLINSGKHNSSIAVDGPKGPIHKVKPGIFEISRLTNTPIFWAGVGANRFITFEKAWNKAILPKPFAQILVEWHGPIHSIPKDQDPKSKLLAEDLESKLIAAKHQAAKEIESRIIR